MPSWLNSGPRAADALKVAVKAVGARAVVTIAPNGVARAPG